ncbi:MAG: cache domain-containing protein, partial [Desulfamplus sp.]|nr:cache domain-containing protein [Desulfamplus sp.]
MKYSWRLKDEEILRPKLSFAKVFAQYQWIVATGIYIDDIDK